MKRGSLFVLVALLLACLVLSAWASCPNNCSGKGTCVNNKCNCTGNWAGEDCSYVAQALTNKVPVSESNLPTFGWAFFYIGVSTGSDLVWSVNQTNTGDCDVYIKHNDYPTRSDYDVRDISTQHSVTVTQTQVAGGKWYAGVYGFISCSFNIAVTVKSGACPKNCSGHGVCGINGCECEPGFSGADCSARAGITPGVTLNDSVGQSEWKVYSVSVPTVPATLTFTLTQKSNGDADIYLNRGSAPSLDQDGYLVVNATQAMVSTIVYEALTAGTYYVGVYGFYTLVTPTGLVDYQLLLTEPAGTCANTTMCSGPTHGTCTKNGCSCHSAFNGTDCENMKTPLTEKQQVGGYVTDGAWNYYHFIATENKELTVSLSQSSTAADCDLYIRDGKRPSHSDYDYADLSQHQNVNLVIPEPQNDIWYIGVYGWSTCNYTISVGDRTNKTCVHGTWDASIDGCLCSSGWTGVYCDEHSKTLSSGVVVNGTVAFNDWTFYTINLPPTHSVEFRLKETSSNSTDMGTVWLYVSGEDYPSLHTYDQSDISTDDRVHSVHISSNHGTISGVYYVGVYGSPYGKQGTTNHFSLVGWYPDF
eukprot:TRINITY_DN403_c0_g1_i1.p1 TRINITY_DN403_c0_g1~~TRINITY_DN403_c0_g1_i1.p1  ORF type:complete len:607 (+),score=43.39 TRINITY_DN403_c0_g1_i1:60-1823(+)